MQGSYVYHRVDPSQLHSILQEGLKRESRGELGDASDIKETDALLDDVRPEALRQAGISRDNNLYGYLAAGAGVVDIRDGRVVDLDEFAAGSQEALLRLLVDPLRCYVSDLEAYDAVKELVRGGKDTDELREAGQVYWGRLRSLAEYRLGECSRPEVMVTYDVAPEDITLLRGGSARSDLSDE